jgi:teichuronic acid exporter
MSIEPINSSGQTLKRRFITSILWLGSGSLAIQLISWASTIVVIRLLTPADYGLMAMSAIVISFLLMICDLGMGGAIIRMENIAHRQIRQILGIIIVINIASFGLTFLSAPLVAAFFGEPRVTSIIRWLSINFILISFYIVPQSLCMKEMAYRQKAQVDVSARILSSMLTLVLAFYGYGVWSLVISEIALHFIKVVGFNLIKRTVVIPVFSLGGVGRFVRFGALLTVDRIFFWAYGHLDGVILGRLLGKELLGLYSVALNLASIPLDKFIPVLTQVSFSAYSLIQSESRKLKSGLLSVTHAVSLMVFPISWGMLAVAPEAIPLILGPKWVSIIVPFQLISIILPFKALSSILPPALFAIGRPGINIVNMAISVCVMATAFLIGVQKGLLGVCLAWVIAYPGLFLIINSRALRVLGIPFAAYLREIWFPLCSAGLMVGGIFLLKSYIFALSEIQILGICIVVGALIYAILILCSHKEFARIKHLAGKSQTVPAVTTKIPLG